MAQPANTAARERDDTVGSGGTAKSSTPCAEVLRVASDPPTTGSGGPQHVYRRYKRRCTRARAPKGSGREVAEGPLASAPSAQSRKRGVRVSPLGSASGDPVRGERLIKDWLQRSLERVPDIGKSAHRLVRIPCCTGIFAYI
eukprot:2166730-Pleurochrysis_carterae.AAC.1